MQVKQQYSWVVRTVTVGKNSTRNLGVKVVTMFEEDKAESSYVKGASSEVVTQKEV